MKSLSLRSHQMAKIPQILQQQPTVANIQQIVTSPQQVGFVQELRTANV